MDALKPSGCKLGGKFQVRFYRQLQLRLLQDHMAGCTETVDPLANLVTSKALLMQNLEV